MSTEVRDLEPQPVWNHFEDLNAIPRPSKKEEKVIEFMMEFGRNLGLETNRDAVGNVVIKKPATPGMEDKPTIVLQSHLDMVHQKNADTNFDFSSEGIRSYIKEGWVHADGTTLGADNGMGVAATMAVLSSNELKHPTIEALFTIDEETGMTGAKLLDPALLDGRILLNLDTEDDDELCIGCAGGIDTNVKWDYRETEPSSGTGLKVRVKGLVGGHSGMDIILGRANANKLMNRLLYKCRESFGLRINSIDGGGLRNAIPRESEALVLAADVEAFKEHLITLFEDIKKEYSGIEPNMELTIEEADIKGKVMHAEDQDALIQSIYTLHNGVYRMSPDIVDLVETSSSLARVIVKEGQFQSQSLQRSSSESAKADLANSIRASFELIGAEVEQSGDYPGWQPLPNAPILKTMKSLYSNLFKEDPNVRACHAGLECGIIGKHFPGMHMISFGPTIKGPHSPDERVKIDSVGKFWKLLVKTLEEIPHMN